ncbi:hypothetical protein H5410_007017 [Solanum commersonii]|uniref:Uncharacterized protein n=1 Tax=Solanum commersonii TaxID=4109 RepID=A0A9J6ACZ2_SOLCO|nr:hypothetical protein H5410_007017 [Solanum commersonii]
MELGRGIVVPWWILVTLWMEFNQGRCICWRSISYAPHCGDQFTNSKQIVEDWKIGWRVNKESENLVKRDEIALLVQSFMDLDSYHGREMRKRAMGIRKIFQESIEGGAIQGNINKFIRDISRGPSQ